MDKVKPESLPKQYRIYGKHERQKTFKAMDLKRGICVGNLLYATILNEADKNTFMDGDAKLNPDWTFEARLVKM